MFRLISILVLLFCGLNYNFSQYEYKTTNYYLVDSYSLNVFHSDDSEQFKDILVDEQTIKDMIQINTGLNEKISFVDYNNEWFKVIYIVVDYGIHKNPYTEEQYYGSFELTVDRILKIPNSDYVTSPLAQIFRTYRTFVNNHPIKSAFKNEIKDAIESLIGKFASDFKSSY